MARGDLTVRLSPDLAWHAADGTGWRGRPQVFTDAAIQCVLTLKVLYQLPLRAAQGMAASLIRLAGLDWPVPHDSTLSRWQRSLTVTIPCRRRGGPLHLVIDSTGLKVLGEGEWKVKARGRPAPGLAQGAPGDRRRQPRGQRGRDADHRHGDGEVVPGLLAQLPKAERIGVISGDGAYDTPGRL